MATKAFKQAKLDFSSDTDAMGVPIGTDAQRPGSPTNGSLRYNSTDNKLEQYTPSGWIAVSSIPTIASFTYPGSQTAINPAGGETVVITGNNFSSGVIVTIDGNAVTSVTRDSGTQLTIVTAAISGEGDKELKVTNADGGSSITTISVDGIPSWSTSSGQIANVLETSSLNTTVNASEPDGGAITYTASNLPGFVTLDTNTGSLTGTVPTIGSDTTYNFTITATDPENQSTPRSFSISSYPERQIEFLFSSPGTYDIVLPSSSSSTKYKKFSAVVVAGGGGGGGGDNTDYGAGGGGGGGLAYINNVDVSSPGNTVRVVVGAGGSGTLNGYGQNGSTSYVNVNSTTVIQANPGTGGYLGGNRDGYSETLGGTSGYSAGGGYTANNSYGNARGGGTGGNGGAAWNGGASGGGAAGFDGNGGTAGSARVGSSFGPTNATGIHAGGAGDSGMGTSLRSGFGGSGGGGNDATGGGGGGGAFIWPNYVGLSASGANGSSGSNAVNNTGTGGFPGGGGGGGFDEPGAPSRGSDAGNGAARVVFHELSDFDIKSQTNTTGSTGYIIINSATVVL